MTISDLFCKEDNAFLSRLAILSVEWCNGPQFTWQCISLSTEVIQFSRSSSLLIGGVHFDFCLKGGIGVGLFSSWIWNNSLNLSLLVKFSMSSFICNFSIFDGLGQKERLRDSRCFSPSERFTLEKLTTALLVIVLSVMSCIISRVPFVWRRCLFFYWFAAYEFRNLTFLSFLLHYCHSLHILFILSSPSANWCQF